MGIGNWSWERTWESESGMKIGNENREWESGMRIRNRNWEWALGMHLRTRIGNVLWEWALGMHLGTGIRNENRNENGERTSGTRIRNTFRECASGMCPARNTRGHHFFPSFDPQTPWKNPNPPQVDPKPIPPHRHCPAIGIGLGSALRSWGWGGFGPRIGVLGSGLEFWGRD